MRRIASLPLREHRRGQNVHIVNDSLREQAGAAMMAAMAHQAKRAAAGRASGAARRAATAERDAALAIRRAGYPGISLARLGEPYGLSPSAVLRAIRRARRDPETAAACELADAERRRALASTAAVLAGKRPNSGGM